MSITTDDDVLHGLPRLEGTRISVLDVYDAVVAADRTPAEAANGLDITLGQVYEALAYYYNNPDEMRRDRERRKNDRAEFDSRVVKPPVEANDTR
ncbi:DUF433 domain-containing protein [Halobacteria archaeon AArc-m2/3/4]|uniref:DUF433 domain-containing protein n=1 Tax=Natronoglomus mannanivorans TaxID=2979990 RepID=A0AAP3E165_9EURY|nr:DUF433 domain-containing protein [Halobacteria archaeon AArc-xg1-1]MCU4972574.1 DUF433 domain-containing protein [Halobacteria archaeon AArc-m2/3/4]